MPPKETPSPPERQLGHFVDKFHPDIAAFIRAVRKAVRRRMPSANELVYDNYNFFVIGYSSTERPSDCIVCIVADAHGVRLAFYHGATLAGPRGLLQGSGNQNRFIRLEAAADLARPEVEELIAAAIAQGRTPLRESGKGTLIIRSVSAKQRPRRKPSKNAHA